MMYYPLDTMWGSLIPLKRTNCFKLSSKTGDLPILVIHFTCENLNNNLFSTHMPQSFLLGCPVTLVSLLTIYFKSDTNIFSKYFISQTLHEFEPDLLVFSPCL